MNADPAALVLTGLICLLFGVSLVLGYFKAMEIRERERAERERRISAAARLDAALRAVAEANRELADALTESREASR